MTANIKKRQIASFATNVIANILANIAAAGIVYLAGAALGIFPKTTDAITSATITVVLTAMPLIAMIGGWQLMRGRGRLLISLLVTLCGTVVTLLGVAELGRSASLLSFFVFASGVAVVAIGVYWIWVDRRRERSRRQEANHIRGLHWVEIS